MFVTIFYALIDSDTRRMSYVRAGHDQPVLLRNGKANYLKGQGTALGILSNENLILAEIQVELNPGDRLILYTDGLSDVLDPSGEYFGRDRLVELFLSSSKYSPENMCESIFEHLISFQGGIEQYDDMTVLVVDVD